nr:D-alanyl-D-alanine carboxypeptidase [Hyphomicrobium methylovorum]
MCIALLASLFAPSADAAKQDPRHATLVIDANTGAVLHDENADAVRHPASLTKMMTLYLTFEMLQNGRLKMSDRMIVSKAATNVAPSKLDLKAGESITVSDAIKALVTKSANDVAVVVAEKIGGSEANFIRLMNARARDLGMTKTHFRNPSGLPDPDHVSSARDMATLGIRLMDDFPSYYPFFATRSFEYGKKTYRNHNTMLNTFQGVDGIKTGYTRASGFNLVTSVVRGNRHVVGVVLGGKTAASRNAEMRVLLTRTLTRASTHKTRKPLLIAKLKIDPKAAVRPARIEQPRVASATPPPAPRLAAPSRKTAVAEAKQPDAADEPGSRETPIQVYKVRNVPILMKPNAATPSDDSTDMESAAPEQRTAPFAPARDTLERPGRPPQADRPGDIRVGDSEQPATIPAFARKSLVSDRAMASNEPEATTARRPAPIGNQVAMLGASDAMPESDVSQQAQPVAFSQPLPRPRNSAAEPSAQGFVRGLAPSTLNAQAAALRGSATPVRNDAPRVAVRGGGYEVQIGAYGSIDDAQRALSSVQDRAKQLLSGVASVTHPAVKDGHQIYRARFAGFDAQRASKTCTELRRRGVDCFVMASE